MPAGSPHLYKLCCINHLSLFDCLLSNGLLEKAKKLYIFTQRFNELESKSMAFSQSLLCAFLQNIYFKCVAIIGNGTEIKTILGFASCIVIKLVCCLH